MLVSDLEYHHENHRELIDTLHLSEREQQAILKHMAARPGHPENEMRRWTRHDYHLAIGLIATLKHPGGTIITYLVRPRDLSSGGISFLHGAFVYPQTQCRFTLRGMDGLSMPVEGEVVRCRHVRGRIHEVGVRFNEPVDLQRFIAGCVRADPEIRCADSAEMPQLSGRLLLVDQNTEHHEALRFQLQKLGVRISIASNALGALQAAQREKFDLIITRYHLPWMNAPQAAAAWRQGGFTGPIIALSDDLQIVNAHEPDQAGLSEVRLQPDHFEDLIRWIQTLLTQPPTAEAA